MKCYNIDTALQHPFKVTHLYMHGLKLKAFPEEIFYFPNLRYIDVSWNNISEIPEAFLKWEKLEGINISENDIEEIPDFINQISTLKEVNFSKNGLSKFPLMSNLKLLEKVDLSHNKLRELPRWVGKWKQLRHLDISYNQIRTLPASIGTWKELRFLFAQYNFIGNLPNSIKNWKQVHTIHLDYNRIRKIPEGIGRPKMLQRIYLENNFIKEIDDNIGNCSALQRLYLQDNKLTEIPPTLGKLKSLQILNISKNKLPQIPEELGTCRQLIRLSAHKNRLEKTPESLSKLKHLQLLDVARNKLHDFPKVPDSIQTLLVNRNPIEELPDWFWDLPNLKEFSGLEHLFPLRLRKRILDYKKDWQREEFSTLQISTLWKTLCRIETSLSCFNQAELFRLLQFKSKNILTKAHQTLTLKSSPTLDKPLFLKGFSVSLLGRTRLSKAFWKRQLEGLEVDFQSKPTPQTSFVVLGAKPKSYQHLLTSNVIFISEKDLCLQVVRLHKAAEKELILSEKERLKIKSFWEAEPVIQPDKPDEF